MPSKRTYIKFQKGFAILIILLLIPKACIELRISDQKAFEQFEGLDIKPSFGDIIVEGKSIHYAYADQNNEAMVVFIHGSPGSWSAFIDYFKADSLFRYTDMLAIDRLGFGKSNYGIAEPSLEAQAKILCDVIRQFSYERIVLVGHSLGGPIIARMAMDYPKLFDGLILVAPSIDPELEKKEWYRGIINSQVGKVFIPTEFIVSNEEIITLERELKEMLPLWPKIKIPCIVIQGTEDFLVPKENADYAKKMLSDSLITVKLLKGENHFIPWSNAGVITEAIYQMVVPQ